MADSEKVIEGLRHCTAWAGLHECQPKTGPDCPYEDEVDCKLSLMRDVLALLKEQKEQIKNLDESLEKARKEIRWLRRRRIKMNELWTVEFSLLMRDVTTSDTPSVDGEMLVWGHDVFDVLEKAKQRLAGFGYDNVVIHGTNRCGFDKEGRREE